MSTHTATLAIVVPAVPRVAPVFGVVFGLASALAFASSGSFMKPLMAAGWSIGATLLLRMGIAAIVLLPVFIVLVRRHAGLLRRHGLLIAGFGLTGVAGCQIFYFGALQRMPVAIALLIQFLAPVLLVALAWVRTRRAPSRRVLTGSVLAITGLVMVVDIAGATFDAVGTLLALGAAVCTAAYFLIAARARDDLPPMALASGGLVSGALFVGVLVGVGIFPFAAPNVSITLAGVTVPWIVPVLWVALISTATSYALGVRAGALLGSRVASFVGLTEVLFALLIAWVVIAEVPTGWQALGGALILSGVVLVKSDQGAVREEPVSSALRVPAP